MRFPSVSLTSPIRHCVLSSRIAYGNAVEPTEIFDSLTDVSDNPILLRTCDSRAWPHDTFVTRSMISPARAYIQLLYNHLDRGGYSAGTCLHMTAVKFLGTLISLFAPSHMASNAGRPVWCDKRSVKVSWSKSIGPAREESSGRYVVMGSFHSS